MLPQEVGDVIAALLKSELQWGHLRVVFRVHVGVVGEEHCGLVPLTEPDSPVKGR